MKDGKKDSYKKYKERRRLDEQQKKQQDFYSSKDWLKLRDVVIADCFGMNILKLASFFM